MFIRKWWPEGMVIDGILGIVSLFAYMGYQHSLKAIDINYGPNGGPAFPTVYNEGMILRDWLIGQCLPHMSMEEAEKRADEYLQRRALRKIGLSPDEKPIN